MAGSPFPTGGFVRRAFLILLVCSQLVAAREANRFYVPENAAARYRETYGEQATKRLNGLLALMESLVNATEEQKVAEINRFFNQVTYATDRTVWNRDDYWASRLEFLGKGRGDCEDFAVAKYLTMVQVGVPEEKVFLTYVKAIGYPDAAHLVVTYYAAPGAVPLVLDNYKTTIEPATERPDLIPVYSFTADDLYLQKQQGLGKRINRKPLKNQKKLKAVDPEIRERGRS